LLRKATAAASCARHPHFTGVSWRARDEEDVRQAQRLKYRVFAQK
jgi:hypothetical protein